MSVVNVLGVHCMMSLIQPIKVPQDLTLRRAADKMREAADDIGLRRGGPSDLVEHAYRRVAEAFDGLAKDCLSTSQLPQCEEARALWQTGTLPRVEITNVGCMVIGTRGR